jgi:hypothetical protein
MDQIDEVFSGWLALDLPHVNFKIAGALFVGQLTGDVIPGVLSVFSYG